MMIVAASALLIKWSILREIHQEVVDQFLENPEQPLYYSRKPFCDKLDYQDFNAFTFPVASVLTILCFLLTKRVALMKDRCHGYTSRIESA